MGRIGAFSVLLIGAMLSGRRKHRKSPAFWAYSSCFVAAHGVVWIFLLRAMPGWRLMWFCAVAFEVAVFEIIDGWLFLRRAEPACKQADR